jgi:hypothetical protein
MMMDVQVLDASQPKARELSPFSDWTMFTKPGAVDEQLT